MKIALSFIIDKLFNKISHTDKDKKNIKNEYIVKCNNLFQTGIYIV